MSPDKSPTSTAPNNACFTERQVAAVLGINLGELIQLRARGARLFDPSFPRMSPDRTFVQSEILAYKKLRDTPATVPATPLDATTSTPPDRRTATDRRAPRV